MLDYIDFIRSDTMSNTNAKPLPIKATLYWANLSTKNAMSNKYQFDMGNLSSGAVAALEERGMKPRNKGDEKGDFITVKSNNPIRAYNTSGDEIGCLVGNGSEATAVIGHYDWKSPAGQQGRSPSCLKLVITDLNEYVEEGGGVDFDLEAAL
jgi:hypothetical protein